MEADEREEATGGGKQDFPINEYTSKADLLKAMREGKI